MSQYEVMVRIVASSLIEAVRSATLNSKYEIGLIALDEYQLINLGCCDRIVSIISGIALLRLVNEERKSGVAFK